MQQVIRVYIAEVSYIFELSNLGSMKMKNNYKNTAYVSKVYSSKYFPVYTKPLCVLKTYYICHVLQCRECTLQIRTSRISYFYYPTHSPESGEY